MRIIPNDDPIVEANDCHEPETGRFCSKGGLRAISDSLRGRLAKGAQAYERRQAERRERKRAKLDAMLRRGSKDFVGISHLSRRLTALGEAEEFPEGFTPLVEANDCHNPPGSPEGGQFCSRDDFAGRAAWRERDPEGYAKQVAKWSREDRKARQDEARRIRRARAAKNTEEGNQIRRQDEQLARARQHARIIRAGRKKEGH